MLKISVRVDSKEIKEYAAQTLREQVEKRIAQSIKQATDHVVDNHIQALIANLLLTPEFEAEVQKLVDKHLSAAEHNAEALNLIRTSIALYATRLPKIRT